MDEDPFSSILPLYPGIKGTHSRSPLAPFFDVAWPAHQRIKGVDEPGICHRMSLAMFRFSTVSFPDFAYCFHHTGLFFPMGIRIYPHGRAFVESVSCMAPCSTINKNNHGSIWFICHRNMIKHICHTVQMVLPTTNALNSLNISTMDSYMPIMTHNTL